MLTIHPDHGCKTLRLTQFSCGLNVCINYNSTPPLYQSWVTRFPGWDSCSRMEIRIITLSMQQYFHVTIQCLLAVSKQPLSLTHIMCFVNSTLSIGISIMAVHVFHVAYWLSVVGASLSDPHMSWWVLPERACSASRHYAVWESVGCLRMRSRSFRKWDSWFDRKEAQHATATATRVLETDDIQGDASGETGEAETTRLREACGSTKGGHHLECECERRGKNCVGVREVMLVCSPCIATGNEREAMLQSHFV